MTRYKAVISYDGTLFAGYQVQPGKRTVQSELEAMLAPFNKQDTIKVIASGRTDSGVHAKGQVIHFDLMRHIAPAELKKAMNAMLPSDILVKGIEVVPDTFHARYDVVRKEYRYIVMRTKDRDPFLRNYALHYYYPLSLEKIEAAIPYFMGTHDFSSFCSARTEVVDKIRTIDQLDFYEEGNQLILRFVGNGFLYNMVRIITGTLLEVGSDKRSSDEIPHMFAAKDRREVGKTIPGHGLYLWKVFYE